MSTCGTATPFLETTRTSVVALSLIGCQRKGGAIKKYRAAKNIKFHFYAVKRGTAAKRFRDLDLGSLDVAISRLARAPKLVLA